jgi:hypothetical protein
MIRAVALMGEVDENPLVMGFEVLQERLIQVLKTLNQKHAESLLAPLVTPGEVPEFQAVLRDLTAAYPLTRALAEALHPLPVRMAASFGDINLPSPPDPEQTDGLAFDSAGELLYRTRKEDRMLLIRGGNDPVDTMANALLLVLYRDLQTWTERQCEVVSLYRHYRRQADVAEELGVSQQSVSSSLAAAGWKMLSEAETSLGSVLADYVLEVEPTRV